MTKNDVYAISARVKNLIAKEDIALSPVGKVLVNYFTLALKTLYDFSDTLPEQYKRELDRVIESTENTPLLVIQVSTPKDPPGLSYKLTTNSNPQFVSNQEALECFQKQYEELGSLYGLTGDGFWFEAENSNNKTEDYSKIMTLRKSIQMCLHLIEEES